MTEGVTFNSAGVPAHTGPFDVLAIGASFGGPRAIDAILTALPRDFPLPVAICQHITPGMTHSWANALCSKCRIRVVEASDRARLEPATAYIAPAGLQMRLMRTAVSPVVRLDPDFADSLHVPSLDVLFSSAASEFGSRTLAVVLTGLGSDGSSGMLHVRQAGGYTICESSDTAASYSMPGSAYEAGAIVEQLPLERIVERVIELGST